MSKNLKGFSDMESESDVSLQDILMGLMNTDGLELKTEIFNPKDLAGLKILANVFKMDELDESAELLNDYIEIFLKYMVSYKRKSRTEIIQAIAGMLDRETKKLNISEKMTTNMK